MIPIPFSFTGKVRLLLEHDIMKWSLTLVAISLILFLASGCASRNSVGVRESNLTPGMVKLSINKGKTTQADILEVFGPPDQVTHRDGKQVWTYDKISYQSRVDSGTLIFYSASSARSTSISTLLIIYFNDADVVYDYRLDSYKF